MSRHLDGKLAIVTGASGGIGAAIATKLASYGANVVLTYTSASSRAVAEQLSAELASDHGVKTLPIQADLGTPTGPSKIVEESKTFFGDNFQIDILVNNAGVCLNARLADVTTEQFNETYQVNVLGPLLLTQAVEPYLPHDRSGRIINVSSVSASNGFIEQSVYGGSKAALESMTRTWARELSERGTVNSVNPGPVMTPMYDQNSDAFKREIRGWIMHAPLMRFREEVDGGRQTEKEDGERHAYPEEIAGIVAMLCSPDAGWCTGQSVSANGGMVMR